VWSFIGRFISGYALLHVFELLVLSVPEDTLLQEPAIIQISFFALIFAFRGYFFYVWFILTNLIILFWGNDRTSAILWALLPSLLIDGVWKNITTTEEEKAKEKQEANDGMRRGISMAIVRFFIGS